MLVLLIACTKMGIASSGMMFTPSVMKICQLIQKGNTYMDMILYHKPIFACKVREIG